MNKTLLFVQADMHRAINEGRRSLDISVLDLKELLSAVASAEGREQAERCGIVFGFVRTEQLKGMRSGTALYCSIRRKKTDEYCRPVYCDPIDPKPVDAVANVVQNPEQIHE